MHTRSVAGGSDSRPPSTGTDGDSLLRAVFGGPSPQPPLVAGQIVAEVYEIVRRVGAGGMGIVYLARDLRLARNVALKLHRTDASSRSVERLVREAQAIAQLTHPNIVTVYQVAIHEGQPFVAMEFVDGGTARTWLAAKPRTSREIVALYLAAGRGLEAAHRAHLVHRDFKPDNVLVGDDGRVRVADFGLVQSPDWSIVDSGDESPDSETLTKSGAVMGTPAYMAPEQRRGDLVDAAADQFAFAVALWEALTGARPFASSDDVTIAAPKKPIARHVELALRKALAQDADARWPTMAPLLEELARDPNARRRRVAWIAGGVVVAGAVVVPLALMRAQTAPEPCGDSESAMESAWNRDRRATLDAGLGAPLGATVTSNLDRYASGWVSAHRHACRDTRVTQSQTEDMLERRMQCLFAARAAVDATVSVLSTLTPEVKRNALDAVARLPLLERCSDIDALTREDPLPTDPVVRRHLEEAERLHANVHAAELDPNRIDRMQSADAALASARAVGWKPLLSRALVTHAQQLALASKTKEAIAELREAAGLALAADAFDVAVNAYADLATFLAERAQLDGAEMALMTARSLDDRSGPPASHRVLIAGLTVAREAGRYDEGIALGRQLVAAVDEHPGLRTNPMSSRSDLAGVLATAGRFEEALVLVDEALAWGVANLGSDHAELGHYHARRAKMLKQLGRFDEAIADGKRALAILEKWYGPDSVHLSTVLGDLGDTHGRAGNVAEMLPPLERALVLARRGDKLAEVEYLELQLAMYFVRVGDLDRAAKRADSLIATTERASGPTSTSLIEQLLLRGYIAREQKRYADAERDQVRALELGKQLGDDQHPGLLNLRVELGKTLIASGRPEAARVMLAPQGAALLARSDIDLTIVVETQVVLANALHALGQRAEMRHAITAAEKLAKATPDRPDLQQLVDAWRATHR